MMEGQRKGLLNAASPAFPARRVVLAAALLLAVAQSCSAPPPRGNLQYIQQDTFRIENPSADRALATGIGCGFTAHDAEQAARETAGFNLRRITGDTRYRVEYSRLKETVEANKVCVELQARAVPARLN